MKRWAFLLAFALVAGFLLTVPAMQDVADGPAATLTKNVSHQPGAAPRPHNDTAALVPHGQLPADTPPVAGLPSSLRFVVSAAKRIHRTPVEVHTPRHGERAPPRPSGS